MFWGNIENNIWQSCILKAHFHRQLEPQHWQFTSMLKWNVNVELIGLILSCQHWSSTSTLKSFVNVEIESWGQMAMLKFNVEVLIACENAP